MSKKCQVVDQIVDMQQIARRGGSLTGRHDIADLTPLHDRLADRHGCVGYSLRPHYTRIDCAAGSSNLLCIEVQLQATVTLLCQRTLQAFAHELQVHSSVVLVADDEQAAGLPDACEPMLADVRAVDVMSLLAEELLLALPLAPVAPQTEPVSVKLTPASPSSAAVAENTGNPFAALGSLLRSRHERVDSGNTDGNTDK